MKLGSGPITRMYLWLRKKQRKKRKQHGNVLLANADGLGRLIVKKGDNAPFLNYSAILFFFFWSRHLLH